MRYRICSFASGFLLLCFTLTASSATVRVHGTVSDAYGTTIRGAMVTFVSSQDSVTAFTDNDGFYEAYLSDDPTGVHDSQHPSAIQLAQNYPNPFNPSTTIQYSLERHAVVRLDVYSITGQHVRTLVNGTVSPGTHSLVWDGHDDDGRGVSAGVYVYRFRAGSEVAVRKMLLLDGSVSGIVAASRTAPVSAGKSARTADSREYTITASKSTMTPYEGDIMVTFIDPEIEQDITISGQYQPYVLYFDTPRVLNAFIVPGDTLGVTLVGVHEELPAEGMVTLTTQTGDNETLTVSGSVQYRRQSQVNFCRYSFYDDSRAGELLSNASQAVVGDGILQMDAVSDTVSAHFVTSFGDTVWTDIPVQESAVAAELWGHTYYQWDGEWYSFIVDEYWPDDMEWWKKTKHSFRISFFDTVDLATIDAFIDDNNLEVGYMASDHQMYLSSVDTHEDLVPFLLEQQGNPIIEDAYLGGLACVAKSTVEKL